MLVTEIYNGQGLGNQLACYVATRVFALDRGYAFGISHPERFKGNDFMHLDFGLKVTGGNTPIEGQVPEKLPDGITRYYRERANIHPINGDDIRLHDETFHSIADNTKIDGLLQDEAYIEHRKNEIREWLTIDPEYECYDYADENTCVLNFRGGEYARHPRFFLEKRYWKHAIDHMRSINPHFRFIVITDDVYSAKKFFPHFDVFHFSIGKDYSIIKNAHYLILSNSSFAWFPAWLSTNLKFCIAPKYWARHNVSDGYWSLGYNITRGWHYLDREGILHTYEDCVSEHQAYILAHPDLYTNTTAVRTTSAGIVSTIKQHSPLWLKTFAKRIITEWRWLITTLRKPYDLYMQHLREERWKKNVAAQTYRSSIKIYDAFNFFNELELLEIRLNILDPFVDYFVLVESTLTHSGMPKDLYYQNNKNRFARFNHKILHFVIDSPLTSFDDAKKRLSDPNTSTEDKNIIREALTSDNIKPGQTSFLRDFYEKEYVKKALMSLGLQDTDFCYISDLDEIWDPTISIDYTRDVIYKYKLEPYMYYLNNRSNEDWSGWTGTIATKYDRIKNSCLNHLRTASKTRYTVVHNGGWHFSFMGGADRVKTKIESYSHQEINNATIKERIQTSISTNQDVRNKGIRYWIDESHLPTYIQTHKETYKELFK